MIPLALQKPEGRALELLFLGAHPDDIEIGCGGTVLRMLSEHEDVRVHWVVVGSTPERAREAQRSADDFLRTCAAKRVEVLAFEPSFFPARSQEIKHAFERIKSEASPDVIFTHFRSDLHQDHRIVNELTWNTFRDHMILEYEVPKYDGDLSSPNFYVPLERETCRDKARRLVQHFATQRDKHWFDEELFLGLARVRGVEARSESGYAEGFYCRKMRF